MANRLNSATSPYLLQHADNPVDWWQWSAEAFAEARRRDVPVLLSVGYAACHWCHVMAHESFEDPATAALVNESVVAIKVDREERPDVDAVYMTATQAMTGQGGWPMTVFMTPDGEPFYCGTYFPRQQFTALVRAVAKAWREDRGNVQESAARISQALAENAAALAGAGAAGAGAQWESVTAAAVASLSADFDAVHGGLGGAPKFPPSMVLEFLLRHQDRTGSPEATRMASATFAAMARGGMYDQLGGGFARYSVDATWTVPHFEKMLYDNALLARAYAHWARLGDGAPLGRRIAEETCEFMLRELRTAEGGFAASLDADSEGGEGAFYVWTPAALRGALGEADGEFAARAFGVTEAGTFEYGTSVLQRREEPDDLERLDRIRGVLFAAREGRPRPARDDKVVAAWNGMTIAALAEAGLLFDRADFVAAAEGAAALLVSVHLADGRLVRTSRDGVAGSSAGLLEDYACLASGLLTLSGVTGADRWAAVAGELLDTVLAEFGDGAGGFYDTAADGERLLFRPADPADNATPSGTFAAAEALLSYGALYGSARPRDAAVAALGVLAPIAERYPRAGGAGLAVAEALLSGPAEIAIVGSADDPRTRDLLRTALHQAPPGAVFALGSGAAAEVPLLAGRGLVRGGPAAYVCRGFTCLPPVTTPAELRESLRA
ncbi:MAG TPA: thioredoxin domain-containing protein [Trebonia sp.]|nr:thioredoxin domain-containing protein [Trebonia sp.]